MFPTQPPRARYVFKDLGEPIMGLPCHSRACFNNIEHRQTPELLDQHPAQTVRRGKIVKRNQRLLLPRGRHA